MNPIKLKPLNDMAVF